MQPLAAGIAVALGAVAPMRDMAQLARDAGLSHEALHRTRYDTIVRVCTALDKS